jgi:hypothetical protein
MELVYYADSSGKISERCNFYALVNDDDGIQDLSKMTLYNDAAGLSWVLPSASWTTIKNGNDTWIGSSGLALAEGSLSGNANFPRGLFRVVLSDQSGETSDYSFSFDPPLTPLYPFPVFSYNARTKKYTIKSRYPVNKLLCYDQEGKYIRDVQISSAKADSSGSPSQLSLAAGTVSAALWGQDRDHAVSALTSQVKLQ